MPAKLTVNGTTYESVEAMPPDVRELYERAMRAMGTGQPVVHNREIKLAFQLSGPNFKFRVGSGPLPSEHEPIAIGASTPPADPTPGVELGGRPRPIEPTSGGAALRAALLAAAFLAAAIGTWVWMRAH